MSTAVAAACANVQDADATTVLGNGVDHNQVQGITETAWQARPTTEVGVQTDRVFISDIIVDSEVTSPDFFSFQSCVDETKSKIMTSLVSPVEMPGDKGLSSHMNGFPCSILGSLDDLRLTRLCDSALHDLASPTARSGGEDLVSPTERSGGEELVSPVEGPGDKHEADVTQDDKPEDVTDIVLASERGDVTVSRPDPHDQGPISVLHPLGPSLNVVKFTPTCEHLIIGPHNKRKVKRKITYVSKRKTKATGLGPLTRKDLHEHSTTSTSSGNKAMWSAYKLQCENSGTTATIEGYEKWKQSETRSAKIMKDNESHQNRCEQYNLSSGVDSSDEASSDNEGGQVSTSDGVRMSIVSSDKFDNWLDEQGGPLEDLMVDSGASTHLIDPAKIRESMRKHVRRLKRPMRMQTANGPSEVL